VRADRGVPVRQGNAVARWSTVLLRLAHTGMTNVFALLRLLPMSDWDMDAEILALRSQLPVCSGRSVTSCGSAR
jgi:hypothetical protein